MSKILKDFIVSCVIESDYAALASLKEQEGGVLDSIYLSMSRELRAAELMLGRHTLEYVYTDAQRQTLIELIRVFGTVQVLKGVTNFALPNDLVLVDHFLRSGEFDRNCCYELRNFATAAARQGQTEVVRAIVKWMLKNLSKADLPEIIYEIYEVDSDPWVFRKMYETGLLVKVLNAARIGRFGILPALLNDINAMQELEKLEVLTAIFRKRTRRA
ncbi:hypothetical protein NP572_19620 [Pseudomonas putida]|uniref:hypothetical protein n=1 Tax=Pseudomonas putida TaxID=303 RepID=UPI002363406E|nr:hypothetical protein [Pseudomonas putida]MDD2038727.1 hypothetical protein [Pseudomonas putida]MDD2044328.1 hypothetical protein [Pseudomonas putida]